MQTLRFPSASHSSGNRESILSIGEFSPAPYSDFTPTSMSPPTPDKTRHDIRPSPSRAPPPPPTTDCANLSIVSSVVASVRKDTPHMSTSSLHDTTTTTTVLSDLSEEIQRVEARLAEIRDEEDRLMPRRSVPIVPSHENPRFASVKVPPLAHITNHATDNLVRSSIEECNEDTSHKVVNQRNTIITAKQTLPRDAMGNSVAFPTPPRQVQRADSKTCHSIVDSRGDVYAGESLPTLHNVESSQVTGEKAIHAFFTASSVSQTQSKDTNVVFSLAPFLNPVRTVEVEVAAGKLEKLDIYAGEDMADVAKRFIATHNLNAERAFEPLRLFLVSLMGSNSTSPNGSSAGNEHVAIPSKKHVEQETNTSQALPLASKEKKTKTSVESNNAKGIGKAPLMVKRVYERDSSLSGRAPRSTQSHTPPEDVKPLRSTTRPSTENVSKMLEYSDKKAPVSGSHSARNDPKKTSPKKREWHVSRSRVSWENAAPRDTNRNKSPNGKCHSETHPPAASIANPAHCPDPPPGMAPRGRSNPPEVVAVEVEEPQRTARGVGARRGRIPLSRPPSAERRAASPFRPLLAPRSVALAAQDASRRAGGPTYARLHARPPKLSAPAAPGGSGAEMGKPRILPRPASDPPRGPVSQRLYQHAAEMRRRLQEKREVEQQRREETERRSLLSAPHPHKGGRSSSAENGRNGEREKGPWPRCASAPRRERKVKDYEGRELDLCTFAPHINPASVRMFNMVVKSQSTPPTPRGMDLFEHEGKQPLPLDRMRSGSCGSDAGRYHQGQQQEQRHQDKASRVEDRLLQHERQRRQHLEEERRYRETVDPRTGQRLFQPFTGR